jgi:hypothetical protein
MPVLNPQTIPAIVLETRGVAGNGSKGRFAKFYAKTPLKASVLYGPKLRPSPPSTSLKDFSKQRELQKLSMAQ